MERERKRFIQELELRTKRFSIAVYNLTKSLPNDTVSNSLKNQLFRSASSIGANYREANRSKSKADFRNKIRICEGEASEAYYWIEIIEDLNLIQNTNLSFCKSEVNELLAIFTSISSKLRART